MAGPSGQSYMSEPQLNAGIEALRAQGEFRDGVYTYHDASGKKHNSDGYEAVWEHVFGKPVQYPKPRYDTPVLLRPDRFDYLPLKGSPGVFVRHLGTFNERRLGLQMLRLESGAATGLGDPDRTLLLYGIDGSWRVEGNEGRAGAAVELLKGNEARLVARTASELYVFALPAF